MPVANNWGFFEQNAQAKQSTASNATDQVNPHNKARGSVGKRSNHDKVSTIPRIWAIPPPCIFRWVDIFAQIISVQNFAVFKLIY